MSKIGAVSESRESRRAARCRIAGSALSVVVALAVAFTGGPFVEAAVAKPSGDGADQVQVQAPAPSPGSEDEGGGYEAQAAPIVWWFVVVSVRSGHAVRVGVRARSARAAQKSAQTIARCRGYAAVRAGAPIRGTFRTANNYKIRVGTSIRQKDGFATFAAFKKKYGEAPSGYEWHHIVEQSARVAGRLPNRRYIHHPHNLIAIPAGIHRRCVNSFMNKKMKNLHAAELRALKLKRSRETQELTLRRAMNDYGYDNHHLFGLRLLRYCGVDVTGAEL